MATRRNYKKLSKKGKTNKKIIRYKNKKTKKTKKIRNKRTKKYLGSGGLGNPSPGTVKNLRKVIGEIFNKAMNKYDEVIYPHTHIPMNKHGRYPEFLRNTPESLRKPENIQQYKNIHEEGWKNFKSEEGWNDNFRQNVDTVLKNTLYKKQDEKEEKEEKEYENKGQGQGQDENKSAEDIDIVDIDNSFKKSPEYPEVVSRIHRLGTLNNFDTPLFTQLYIKNLELNYKFQFDFNSKLNNIVQNNIDNQKFKEEIIKYNDESTKQENINFIGWTASALLTGYNMASSKINHVIQKTAEGVAIAKCMVVNNYTKLPTYLSRSIPLGISTGIGLIDWGLFQSVSALVTMGSSKDVDWKKQENIDEYNKNLVTTLDVVLNVVLKDLIKKGCKVAIPKIVGNIINKQTINIISEGLQKESEKNSSLSELLNTTNDYCNKILPSVAKYYKNNGFSKGIGPEATEMLTEFNGKSFILFKDIFWEICKNTWNEGKLEIKYSDTSGEAELQFNSAGENPEDQPITKSDFDSIFNRETLNTFIKIIVSEAEKAYDTFSNINHSEIIDEIKERYVNVPNSELPQPIIEEETKMKEDLDNTLKDKVSVGDFITNLMPSIANLLLLWNKEIYKTDKGLNNDAVYLDSLLNVLDLRINTLIKETCEIHAKSLVGNIIPTEACGEKFLKISSLLYDKPINQSGVTDEDLSYVKKIIRRIIMNVLSEKVNQGLLPYHKYCDSYSETLFICNTMFAD